MFEQDSSFFDRTRGSHRQCKHAVKPGLVTVPGKPGDDLGPSTFNSISSERDSRNEKMSDRD
jgi:predicted RNA binding protein YcfA (HicA-like mRNA interferase family)